MILFASVFCRKLALGALLLLAGSTADAAARRARRYPRPPAPPAAVVPRPPAPQPVRNVILFYAEGYSETDWREARAVQPNGLVSLDGMLHTGIALIPAGVSTQAGLANVLGIGLDVEPDAIPGATTMFQAARQVGKTVALVSGGAVTDPLPAFLAVPSAVEPPVETLRRLAVQKIDVLFGRSANDNPAIVLEGSSYALMSSASSVLVAEAMPACATVPAEELSFDALVYRALHLAARPRPGFVMGIYAKPETVRGVELSSAVASALDYARREKRTLVLVVTRTGDGPALVYAAGLEAGKFGGTLMLSDIPKILAGVMNVKPFRRDFSPLFVNRKAQLETPTPAGMTAPAARSLPPVLSPLPW